MNRISVIRYSPGVIWCAGAGGGFVADNVLVVDHRLRTFFFTVLDHLPQQHMKRIRYEPQVKEAIKAAVNEARKSGKKWSEALVIATRAGYKGTAGGLVQLMAPSKPATKTSKPATSAPAAAPAVIPVKKTKVKAKQKYKAKAKAAAPVVKAPTVKPAATQASCSLGITALVHKTVTDAVVSALEGLLASLKGGK